MHRPIHLLHDSRMLARMIGVEAPCCDMVAMPTSGKAEPFCACTLANPLREDFLLDLDAPSERFLCYSGCSWDRHNSRNSSTTPRQPSKQTSGACAFARTGATCSATSQVA